jgi:hypothetical protein
MSTLQIAAKQFYEAEEAFCNQPDGEDSSEVYEAFDEARDALFAAARDFAQSEGK